MAYGDQMRLMNKIKANFNTVTITPCQIIRTQTSVC